MAWGSPKDLIWEYMVIYSISDVNTHSFNFLGFILCAYKPTCSVLAFQFIVLGVIKNDNELINPPLRHFLQDGKNYVTSPGR